MRLLGIDFQQAGYYLAINISKLVNHLSVICSPDSDLALDFFTYFFHIINHNQKSDFHSNWTNTPKMSVTDISFNKCVTSKYFGYV